MEDLEYFYNMKEKSQGDGRFKSIGNSIRSGLVLTEVLPTNEIIRASLFGVSQIISRDPAVGALALGISTFMVEEVGGYAASGLFNTETGNRAFQAIHKKLENLRTNTKNEKLSPIAKAGIVILGGTVVGMSLENIENPTRTTEMNKKYSLFTSAWLGGLATIGGLLASEGINIGLNNPVEGGIIAGSLIAGGIGYKAISKICKTKKRSNTNEG